MLARLRSLPGRARAQTRRPQRVSGADAGASDVVVGDLDVVVPAPGASEVTWYRNAPTDTTRCQDGLNDEAPRSIRNPRPPSH
jgi:hypothetical protein